MDKKPKMKKASVRNQDKIVSSFNSKWKYRLDKEQYGAKDAWKIIRSTDSNGKYVGDCEDYALSVLWRIKDESDWKFWWSLITRESGICLVGPSKWKVSHAVLRYKGQYVDNWTKKFGPKSAIEKNHTFHTVFGHGLLYMTVVKMVMSKITRTIKQ